MEQAILGGGCFWCVEAIFESVKGVHEVYSGYAGGHTKNPNYNQIGTGRTGHAEAVEILYDQTIISYRTLLEVFFSTHNPTTLNKQGNDIGTQYRSAIFISSKEDLIEVKNTMTEYQTLLTSKGFNKITTEIKSNVDYYFAESYHQQYLYKNPNGYCGLGGCGIRFN